MQLDEVADDRETEAQAAVRPGDAAVGLPKPFEHVRYEVRVNADAVSVTRISD
jgi:hypothetical protein